MCRCQVQTFQLFWCLVSFIIFFHSSNPPTDDFVIIEMDYCRLPIFNTKYISKALGWNSFKSEAKGNFENNKFIFGIFELYLRNNLTVWAHERERYSWVFSSVSINQYNNASIHYTVIPSFAIPKTFTIVKDKHKIMCKCLHRRLALEILFLNLRK